MPSRVRTQDEASRRRDAELDKELDRALAQTFPASDPFSVGQFTGTEPPARPVDREAPRPEPARASRRKRT